MIKSLSIRNFAVIEKVEVEFEEGLNLLTGETGSGKSIIVDALGLLLGERGSLTQIRTGESSAFVEGIFEVSGEGAESLRSALDESGIEFESDNEVIIRREITANGKSRVFVNDRSVTLSVLRRLQPLLVEIHGQGEQRLLLSTRAQMDVLDSYAGCQSLRARVREAYTRWKSSLEELQKFTAELKERERTMDLLQYQLSEIDSVAPQPGEDVHVAQERKLMAHAEKIIQLGGAAYGELYEHDASVLARLANVSKQVQELSSIDERLKPILESLKDGAALVSDVAESVRSYIEGIEFSPEEFARLDNRLAELERLKRKFGADLDSILSLRDNIAQKLKRLTDLTEHEQQLKNAFEEARKDYIREAAELTLCRQDASQKLAREVEGDLQQVALERAQFIVSLETSSYDTNPAGSDSESADKEREFFSQYGADQVRFMFSANPGEAARPLSQVASGGELSRLMLTLLNVGLKNLDRDAGVETAVFDEIDAGIGGGVAEAVGRRLKNLARAKQVLCVTHQPQIARFADAHYTVEKSVRGGRTLTSVHRLQGEESVRELARMIAGDRQAQTALETARWMLENSEL
jgi:DNA repair protein RecN (Recombination protein N)